jgi:hypothetical protein
MLGLISGAVSSPAAVLDPDQERRVHTGARVFRSMLAADVEIEKKVLPDGRLLVLFIYDDDERGARRLADVFAAAPPICKLAVVAEAVSAKDLPGLDRRSVGGLFLAQPPPARVLREVLDFGKARRVLVYSPFEGHVEEGVPGGLAVEAQVRPFINERALSDARITLKDFFLRAAKVYR